MNLSFSFLDAEFFGNYILKGLQFSIVLTIVATIGGILFGTVLALMRLSGKKWLEVPWTDSSRRISLMISATFGNLLLPRYQSGA